MKKDNKIPGISQEHKEALALLGSRPEFNTFVKFLRVQQNNIAIIEWFRIKSSEPDLNRRKAYFEGMYDFINTLIEIFNKCKKDKEDEE